MYEKEKFTKFLEKFYLNGKILSAIIESKDKKLRTLANNEEKDLRCLIELDDFGLKDCEVGCYSTSKLLGMLNILESGINITTTPSASVDGAIATLIFTDTKGREVKFAAMENLDNIGSDGKKGQVKVYDALIHLNQEVVNDILKAAGALADNKKVTFLTKNNKFFIVFNYSRGNENSISLELEAENFDDEFENISFSLPNLKEILNVNGQRFDEGTLEISQKGVLKAYFKDLDSTAEYWIISLQSDN